MNFPDVFRRNQLRRAEGGGRRAEGGGRRAEGGGRRAEGGGRRAEGTAKCALEREKARLFGGGQIWFWLVLSHSASRRLHLEGLLHEHTERLATTDPSVLVDTMRLQRGVRPLV